MGPGPESESEVELEGTPAARGFRWPAEWEPHAATWLVWPHNPDTWSGHLQEAIGAFVAMIAALQGRESVHVLVDGDAREEQARRALGAGGVDADRGICFERVATNDSWIRDTGPIGLVDSDGAGNRLLVDFGFDAWGGKYPPWELDDAVPAAVARCNAIPRVRADFVLEGGSVDGNGDGTVLTTESCLLHPNREPGRTREQMERRLRDWLGAEHVLWLGDGIAGDDTDGHVDDIARFVGPSTVVAAVEDDSTEVNHEPLARNLARLSAMRDRSGAALTVVPLPMPPPLTVAGQRCPASYTNFYLANGVALVPVFGARSDERALAVLREVLEGREVVEISCRALVVGLGAVHCLTQQEPAPPRR